MDVAEYFGIPVTLTSGYRSWAEQTKLRRNFEQCVATNRYPSAPDCLYPANRPGDSAHNWGLAWDSTVPERDQDRWDYIRRYVGFEVLPHDRIHAQVPSWRAITSRWPGPPR